MIKNKEIQTNNFIDNILLFFFCIYPVTFLFGNFLINLFLIIINLIFIYGLLKNHYSIKILNKYVIYLLFFLFLTFLINLIFSNNFILSFPRILKFILIIGSIISFKTLLTNFGKNEINRMYKIWSIIFLIVTIDITFELIFGHNILGFKSFMPGRIASFSGQELNIGHFFSAFCLIFLSYTHINHRNSFMNLIIAIVLIIISFLIGERSNFIRTLLIISLFIFLIYEIKIKYKIFSFTSIIIFFLIFLNFNPDYKLRYSQQFTQVLSKEGLKYYLDNSIYGAHFNVAKEIYKDNRFFGVGIKNFRVESFSDKYDNLNHKLNNRRGNTHPHQVHYEFLAETGAFGYASFAIFIFMSFYISIKNFLKKKNLYQLSGILFIFVSLLPMLPSGSFFSTYTSSLFWLHYAIMVGYIKKKSTDRN